MLLNGKKMLCMLMLAAAAVGCSSSSSDDAASTVSALTIAGTLGTESAMMMKASGNASMAVSLADLEIYAIAFTSPPVIAEADVASDGSFTVSLPGAKGSAVTAIFRDKTDNSQVGTIVFEDTSSKDLNGNASQSSSIVLSDSVSLGSITLGTDGKVVIPVSQIAAQIGSAPSVDVATAFDPTGTWYMKAYDGTLPTGYENITTDCDHGPCIGFPMTMFRMTGKKFTATTNCDIDADPVVCAEGDGTVGTEDRYALSLWGDTFTNGVGACGSKTGFSEAEARAGGGIHLTSLPTVAGNAIGFGDYVFTTPTGFGGDAAPFNLPWMKTGALSTRPVQDCRPVTVTYNSNNFSGWACKAEVMDGPTWPGVGAGTFAWQVGVQGGGCFNTATSKPVNVTNWNNLGHGNTCTSESSASTHGAGFNTSTCTYSNADHDGDPATAAINFSCTHTGGQFDDNAGAPDVTSPWTPGQDQFLGQPETLVAQGQLCSSITDATVAKKLAAYRCYAEAYWQNNNGSVACKREYNFNWAATTAEEFANDSGRGKPKNAFITNILNYTPDGQTATLEDVENNNFTMTTGANSSTFCEASRRTVISFKKVSATRILADLKQSGQMNSTAAACLSAAKDALAGKEVPGSGDLEHTLTPSNVMFYLDTTN